MYERVCETGSLSTYASKFSRRVPTSFRSFSRLSVLSLSPPLAKKRVKILVFVKGSGKRGYAWEKVICTTAYLALVPVPSPPTVAQTVAMPKLNTDLLAVRKSILHMDAAADVEHRRRTPCRLRNLRSPNCS